MLALCFFHRGGISSQVPMRNLADVSWTHHLHNQSMPVGSMLHRSVPLKVDVALTKAQGALGMLCATLCAHV